MSVFSRTYKAQVFPHQSVSQHGQAECAICGKVASRVYIHVKNVRLCIRRWMNVCQMLALCYEFPFYAMVLTLCAGKQSGNGFWYPSHSNAQANWKERNNTLLYDGLLTKARGNWCGCLYVHIGKSFIMFFTERISSLRMVYGTRWKSIELNTSN